MCGTFHTRLPGSRRVGLFGFFRMCGSFGGRFRRLRRRSFRLCGILRTRHPGSRRVGLFGFFRMCGIFHARHAGSRRSGLRRFFRLRGIFGGRFRRLRRRGFSVCGSFRTRLPRHNQVEGVDEPLAVVSDEVDGHARGARLLRGALDDAVLAVELHAVGQAGDFDGCGVVGGDGDADGIARGNRFGRCIGQLSFQRLQVGRVAEGDGELGFQRAGGVFHRPAVAVHHAQGHRELARALRAAVDVEVLAALEAGGLEGGPQPVGKPVELQLGAERHVHRSQVEGQDEAARPVGLVTGGDEVGLVGQFHVCGKFAGGAVRERHLDGDVELVDRVFGEWGGWLGGDGAGVVKRDAPSLGGLEPFAECPGCGLGRAAEQAECAHGGGCGGGLAECGTQRVPVHGRAGRGVGGGECVLRGDGLDARERECESECARGERGAPRT